MPQSKILSQQIIKVKNEKFKTQSLEL